MNVLSAGLTWVDLRFRGYANAIATAVVSGAGGVGLIDPGPSTCLPVLEDELGRQGLGFDDVRWLLLTHIHLDHAGGVGCLVQRCPGVTVYVHERGARHLHDPSQLLASAEQLYGDRMAELWGDVVAVPESNLAPLRGGERIEVGGRRFEVAYTPGHATHHVSYFDSESRVAFVGDTAGVCVSGGYVLPPTPPPDIDVEHWQESVDRILAWAPESLFLTHFGSVSNPRSHLRALEENLGAAATMVQALLKESIDDDIRRARFLAWMQRELRRSGQDEELYGAALPIALSWYGLEHYWRRHHASADA
jgi:glyoxylase-like metal-dependent hydrolase (beta-lactamase superfamily II)